MQDHRLRHVAVAGAAGLTLVGLVALLVTAQSPETPPVEAPVIVVPPELQARAEAPTTEALPDIDDRTDTIVDDEAAEDLEVEEVADTPAEPPLDPQIDEAPLAQAPTQVPPPVPEPSQDREQASADPPSAPTSLAVSPDSFRVQFASIEDLAGLVEDTHVILVLEFPDGRRFRLPQRLLANTVTLPIADERFAEWLGDGRVSELVPTPELRQRLSVYGTELRYLAVLDTGLRDRVATLASSSADPALLTIARGPVVSLDEG